MVGLNNIFKNITIFIIVFILINFSLNSLAVKLNNEVFVFIFKFTSVVLLVIKEIGLDRVNIYRKDNMVRKVLVYVKDKDIRVTIRNICKTILLIFILVTLDSITNTSILIVVIDSILKFRGGDKRESTKCKTNIVLKNYINVGGHVNWIKNTIDSELFLPIVSMVISICLYLRNRKVKLKHISI